MSAIASQITSLTIVYSIVYSDADQRKHQSSASLAFVWGIHRGPLNSPPNWPVTRKMFPFDDVIMSSMHLAPGKGNDPKFSGNDAVCRRRTWSTWVQVMSSHIFGAKPSPELTMTYCQDIVKLNSKQHTAVKFSMSAKYRPCHSGLNVIRICDKIVYIQARQNVKLLILVNFCAYLELTGRFFSIRWYKVQTMSLLTRNNFNLYCFHDRIFCYILAWLPICCK